jgi:very-short-patch-repair endonuclease
MALGAGTPPKSSLEGVRSQKQAGSVLEDHLLASMRLAGLPEPEREFRFHPTRKWLLDFAWPARMLAVEIEGGIYRGGGHTTVAGIKRDIDKSNALTMLGWRLLRFHGDQVRSGEARALIEDALR